MTQPAQGGAIRPAGANLVGAPAPQQGAPAPLPIAAVRPPPPSLHIDPRYLNENRTRAEVARFHQPQPSREAVKARDKLERDIASEQTYLNALVQNIATASPLARQTYQQNIATSRAEIDRLQKKIVDLGLTGTSAQLEAYTVRYLNTPQERAAYQVTPGPSFLAATSKQQIDTSKFTSYGSGSGFGSFVLSPTGELYVGEHRIQRFHHSSFLAGGEVAAAGEMKIVNGKLTELTNKSGHYKPTPAHTLALLDHLARNKVPLAGVRLGLVDPASSTPNTITWFEDAEQWLRQQHQQVPGAVAQ